MTQIAEQLLPSVRKSRSIPPLQNGDQLSRDEFERRWNAMPDLTHAELIEGTIFISPPLSPDFHSALHFDLITLLGTYRMATPGITGGDSGSVRLDFKNMPQPDIYLMILPAYGGQSKIDEDSYVSGAPEFIAEIAHTSASYDLPQKLEVYRRNEVREYVVWRTMDAEFDFMILKDGRYQKLAPDEQGIIKSTVLPGLWLNVCAALRGDWAAVFASLQLGIGSTEQTEFVSRLRQTFEARR